MRCGRTRSRWRDGGNARSCWPAREGGRVGQDNESISSCFGTVRERLGECSIGVAAIETSSGAETAGEHDKLEARTYTSTTVILSASWRLE